MSPYPSNPTTAFIEGRAPLVSEVLRRLGDELGIPEEAILNLPVVPAESLGSSTHFAILKDERSEAKNSSYSRLQHHLGLLPGHNNLGTPVAGTLKSS